MTIILSSMRDAAACVRALINAGRVYTVTRNEDGEFLISTRD